MATYGYAGDFSSDDDEKVSQDSTVHENQTRLSRARIEEHIETIKKLPYDEDINLTHDALAGILDYYKIQRGPIVDSTRKLYTKIALRSVRGDMGRESTGADGQAKELNGNGNSNNNDNNTSQQTSADAFSSDDEDIEITGVKNGVKSFDIRAVHNNNNNNNLVDIAEDEDEDKMEVDSEDHHKSRAPRNVKPIDLVTTEEDDNDSTTSDESESDDEGSNDDEPKMTPIKPLPSAAREKEAIEVLLAMHPDTPKQTESSSLRRQPLAQSTPKESTTDTAKKPYTRSQRVTRSTAKGVRDMKKLDSSSSSADVFIEKKQGSRRTYTPVVLALVVLALGFLAYHFRSTILTTTEPLFRKKLTF